jgi:NB-ARC domain
VLVVGPHALESEYVRAEWQVALSERKPVVTALRRVPDGIADPYTCLPPELKSFHAEDFRGVDGKAPSLDALVRLLSDPIPPPPEIYGVLPERPPRFHPRPDLFSRIFAAVLGETTGPIVRTHENRVTVLTGMGGIGKTVLAVSLVQALRSQPTKFLEDGVFWLSGDPLRRLATLCHARVTDFRNEADIFEAVASELNGRRFLLVVDNAERVEQIAPLVRVLGPGGRLLVTTRHGELAVGHLHIRVDPLSEAAALQLAADWLACAAHDLPAEARQVIRLCGFHPFAVALNAAAAQQGLAWSAMVTALERRELAYLEHKFEEYVYATVEASLKVSLDALPKADRTRYGELAAFFWDGGVPAATLLRFWDRRGKLPAHRGQKLLVFLQQRSLLQLRVDGERRDVQLHDLHLAYIGRDERTLRSLGRTLLESWQPAQRDAWWTIADDGYLRRTLLRHLVSVRPAADALALISAEDDEQRNAWYGARLHRSAAPAEGDMDVRDDGFAGYVADLDIAAQRIDDCLLVIIAASLRSLASVVPGELLGAAVGGTRWSLTRAIAHAGLVADPAQQARARISLLPKVDDRPTWLEETLDVIGTADVRERRGLVEALAPSLTTAELLPALQRFVSWTDSAPTPYDRNQTVPLVHILLRRLPAEFAPKALELVDTIGLQAIPLLGLLPEPERSRRIEQALAAGNEPGDVGVAIRAMTVSLVARYVEPARSAALVRDALADVRALDQGAMRYEGLLELLPCLPPQAQAPVLDELIDAARKQPSEFIRLARETPAHLRARLRAAVEEQDLAWIAGAAPAFDGADREALVDRALSQIESRDNAASLLWMNGAALTLAMNDRQLARARDVIDAQLDGKERVSALIGVAQAGSPGHRERALDDALVVIDALPRADERASAHARVAPLLSESQVAQALRAAQRIGEPSGVGEIVKLLPWLSATTRTAAAGLIADHARANGVTGCVRALKSIPASADIGGLDPLVALAEELERDGNGAALLAALAPRLSPPLQEVALSQARAAIARSAPGRARFALWLQIGDASAAERELAQAAGTLHPDTLAARVALLARSLPPERVAHWIEVALKAGANGKAVLETVAAHFDAETALQYLAPMIVPNDPVDRMPLFRVMARGPRQHFVGTDNRSGAAFALARRLGVLGQATEVFRLVKPGRDDAITLLSLVGLSPWLARSEVLDIERRLANASAAMSTLYVSTGFGRRGTDGTYATGLLAPALARAGEFERALRHAEVTEAATRVQALLGVAGMVKGRERAAALARVMPALLGLPDVIRTEQVDDVARALAKDRRIAADAWSAATRWARGQRRHEAVEMLAALAPVAASVGGTPLVDEVFRAIERPLRWWP